MSNQAKLLLKEHAGSKTMEEIIDIALNEKPESKGRWKPEVGESFYFISETGRVMYANDPAGWFIDWNYSQINCFKTEQEGEKELERLTNIAEMRDWLEDKNEGWEPDWNDMCYKWYFAIDRLKVGVYAAETWQPCPGWKYGRSEQILKEMLKKFGQEKIKQFIEA